MSVDTTETFQVWREESTPSFGGPHGLFAHTMAVETGDGSGGNANHTLLAPVRGLYVIDWWLYETNTDGEGFELNISQPEGRGGTTVRAVQNATTARAGVGLGFSRNEDHANLYSLINHTVNLGPMVRATRANVNTETSRFSCGGRWWDLALIRGREVPINWPR